MALPTATMAAATAAVVSVLEEGGHGVSLAAQTPPSRSQSAAANGRADYTLNGGEDALNVSPPLSTRNRRARASIPHAIAPGWPGLLPPAGGPLRIVARRGGHRRQPRGTHLQLVAADAIGVGEHRVEVGGRGAQVAGRQQRRGPPQAKLAGGRRIGFRVGLQSGYGSTACRMRGGHAGDHPRPSWAV